MKEMYVMMMMIIFPAKQLCIAKSLNLKQYGLLFVEFTEILWTFHNKKYWESTCPLYTLSCDM